MDRDRLLTALGRETEAFADVLRTADLSTPVAACPGWDLTGLAAHLAGVHRWASTAVLEGVMREHAAPPLHDRDAVVGWYAASAAGLLQALQDTPPGTPCPGFGAPPGTVGFWVRRQAHETAVHRWDAERAAGLHPRLDDDLSADGVSEVVEVLLPRQVRLGRTPPPAHAVALARTDGPGRWSIGDGAPAAVVRADAPTLLLLLWRRVALNEAHVEGDLAAARAVLSGALAP